MFDLSPPKETAIYFTETTPTADVLLQSFPGDMLQIDLVGKFNSPVYNYILSGIDVFTKYLIAVPLTKGSADIVAKELVRIFFDHSYLPTTIYVSSINFYFGFDGRISQNFRSEALTCYLEASANNRGSRRIFEAYTTVEYN